MEVSHHCDGAGAMGQVSGARHVGNVVTGVAVLVKALEYGV